MTVFTPHQDAALNAVADWLKAKPGKGGTPQTFRLFGYAGTGKTTLARHVAQAVDGKVLFAAFTGKAALVMRSKGCERASTIHSLIYKTRESGEEVPSFELWDDAPASKASLIVIDECSMVDAELGRDLMSFGVPLLVLGDPAQLPPIQGGGFAGELPATGDKLVCLRNNKRKGLFNGALWSVKEKPTTRREFISMRLQPDDGFAGKGIKVSVRPECFTGGIEDVEWMMRKHYEEFDYGYVLTVHKSQGSQWDDVVLFDESMAFGESRQRWLYTGVTRAAKRLTVVM